MIRNGAHVATTEAEREAVYRFRYDVYVEEMGRYRGVADHVRRRFREPEDDTARIFYAAVDGEVVATQRFNWGGDAPFTDRLVEHYRLEPFLAEIPLEAMAVGERAMVKPTLRGSSVFDELGARSQDFVSEERVQLIFGACEPHLLPRYVNQGSRTFAAHNINSPEAGYLIPIVNVVEDIDYLRRIGSPSVENHRDWGPDKRVPDGIERLLTDHGNVISQRLASPAAYVDLVHAAVEDVDEHHLSALEGLTDEEILAVVDRSNIIHCDPGDHVIKQGSTSRNLFVVLDGHLESRDGGALVGVHGPGDVFGAAAFLLERPRVVDVYAATECRVLSLSQHTLHQAIDSDAHGAAHLMLNISKILCLRLLERH